MGRLSDPRGYTTRLATGLLHGGVSVVLAETLGSCAAAYANRAGAKIVVPAEPG